MSTPVLHQPGARGRDLTRQCFYWVQSYLSEVFLNQVPVPGSQPAIQLPLSGEKNAAGELVYNENDWKVALHLITLLPWWSLPFCCSLGRRHLPVSPHMWYQLFLKRDRGGNAWQLAGQQGCRKQKNSVGLKETSTVSGQQSPFPSFQTEVS